MSEETFENDEEIMTEQSLGEDCSAGYVEDDKEFKCRKKNYWSKRDEEYFEHSGGHWYMTDETYDISERKRREGWHYDNEALLSLRPAASHAPEDCDQTGFCSWRKYGG